MTLARMLSALPVVQRLAAKTTFVGISPVKLRKWSRLDEASAWAENRWNESRQKYRRDVDPTLQTASFEFEHIEEAIEFLMRFGETIPATYAAFATLRSKRFARDAEEVRFKFDADEGPPFRHGSYTGGASAHRRIEHHVAGAGITPDQITEQIDGLLSRMQRSVHRWEGKDRTRKVRVFLSCTRQNGCAQEPRAVFRLPFHRLLQPDQPLRTKLRAGARVLPPRGAIAGGKKCGCPRAPPTGGANNEEIRWDDFSPKRASSETIEGWRSPAHC